MSETAKEPRSCDSMVLPLQNGAERKSEDIVAPTIIINTLLDGTEDAVSSTCDLHMTWFSRPTGGVYIEVSRRVHASVCLVWSILIKSRRRTKYHPRS